MVDEQAIRMRCAAIRDQLTEKGRRLFVAAEKAHAERRDRDLASRVELYHQPQAFRVKRLFLSNA